MFKPIMYKKEKSIKAWLNSLGLKKFIIHKDLTVDVNENVKLSGKNLKTIPIQFGVVNGSFDISFNKLKSLKGSPYQVDGDFYCFRNELTSLKYCPQKIGNSISCSGNQIDTLYYLPAKIGGDFNCGHNPNLSSLKNVPECCKLLASKVNIQLDEYIDLKCKSFFHTATTENEMIEIFKNYYVMDGPNYFELVLFGDQVVELMQPLKEKSLLEKNLSETKNVVKKMKL